MSENHDDKDSGEGAQPPNKDTRVAKRRPFNARLFAEDLATVLVVAGREAPENRWRTLELGLITIVNSHSLLKYSARKNG